jgi:signal transduction histidine kinase
VVGDDRRGEAGAGLTANSVESRATVALVEALSPLDARMAGLLSALSHQLRNPLTTVLGYLELVTDGSLGPLTVEQQRVLRIVAAGMTRLTEFVEDLEPGASAGRG